MQKIYKQSNRQPKKKTSQAAKDFAVIYLLVSIVLELAFALNSYGLPWLSILGLANFAVAWCNAAYRKII